MFSDWHSMTDAGRERWEAVLGTLAAALPVRATGIVVDGEHAAAVADRLADALRAAGRHCVRLNGGAASSTAHDVDDDAEDSASNEDQDPTPTALVTVADGPRWLGQPPTGRWDVVVSLRARGDQPASEPAKAQPRPEHQTPRCAQPAAFAVIDLGDPAWPVIRRMTGELSVPEHWYVAENQAFFSVRAAAWDSKFGDDLPAYRAAVVEAAPPVGGTALDLGCGTGRALPALRAAVGPNGRVIGLDLTPQMLDAVRSSGRDRDATGLLLADAQRLPFADGSVDTIFAAGLINHLDNPRLGLRELARVTSSGGRLVIFHPTGRAALAARHGRVLRPDEPLAESVLDRTLSENGWKLAYDDDAEHRFLAIATRV